jgi:hypothetical protein
MICRPLNPGAAGSDWRDIMSGGNWHPVQYIDAMSGTVKFPIGPLILNPGEVARWVDAWIVQSSTGSAQTCYGSIGSGAFGTPNQWTANVFLYNKGRFRPGPAVGIALLYVRDGNRNEYFWWSQDPIELQ